MCNNFYTYNSFLFLITVDTVPVSHDVKLRSLNIKPRTPEGSANTDDILDVEIEEMGKGKQIVQLQRQHIPDTNEADNKVRH